MAEDLRAVYPGVSISQISRAFDIARISNKAKRQNWVKLSPEVIEVATQAELHAVHSVSTRLAGAGMQSERL